MSEQGTGSAPGTITIVGPISGESRAYGARDIIQNTVNVDQVRQNYQRFLEGLKEIIAVDVPAVGAFELEEVQFSAEISADGEFKLMGTGIGVEASSGVTFTLKRKASAKHA